MRKVTIDFRKIKDEVSLNIFLAEELNLPSYMSGEYGYNLAAFWDVYAYSDDDNFFELININTVTDKNFKESINAFIDILNDLKGTNKNFSFEII